MTTGMLVFLLLASALLTAPVSLFLLWRYRRAVIRAMAGRSSREAPALSVPAVDRAAPATPLEIETLTAASAAPMDSPAYRQVRQSLRTAIGIHVAAGLAYAAV